MQSSAECRRYVARGMPCLVIHSRDPDSARFERARMVVTIALKFCVLHTIGLGAINAAVRLRCGDYALASRIGALSFTSSIHLFSPHSRRTDAKRLMHARGHIPHTARSSYSNVSPSYGEASKEHIRTALVSCHLGSEGVPDVLVTRDEANRRSDPKVVKDLRSLFILDSVLVSAKLLNVSFQWTTNSVVIESRSKAVILSTVEKTMREQRNARVASNCVGLLRGIAESAQYSDSAKRLAAREFASDCPGV